MLPMTIALIGVAAALVLLARTGRVEERHVLLWLATLGGAVVAASPLVRPVLARALGVEAGHVAPAAAVAAAVILGLYAYTTLARLGRQNRLLAQRVALLEESGDEGRRT